MAQENVASPPVAGTVLIAWTANIKKKLLIRTNPVKVVPLALPLKIETLLAVHAHQGNIKNKVLPLYMVVKNAHLEKFLPINRVFVLPARPDHIKL